MKRTSSLFNGDQYYPENHLNVKIENTDVNNITPFKMDKKQSWTKKHTKLKNPLELDKNMYITICLWCPKENPVKYSSGTSTGTIGNHLRKVHNLNETSAGPDQTKPSGESSNISQSVLDSDSNVKAKAVGDYNEILFENLPEVNNSQENVKSENQLNPTESRAESNYVTSNSDISVNSENELNSKEFHAELDYVVTDMSIQRDKFCLHQHKT